MTPPSSANGRRTAWVAIAAAVIALLAVASFDGGGAETDVERIQRLNQSFACPVCDGESVADSNSAVAAEIREFVALQVSEGATDLEIRDQLVAAYDSEVLRNPPAEGVGALVWVLPVVFVVGGAAGIAAIMGRYRDRVRPVTDADRELVRQARRSSAHVDTGAGSPSAGGSPGERS